MSILTSKFIEMGGLAHFFLSLVGKSSISALIWDSFIPAMRLILNTDTERCVILHFQSRRGGKKGTKCEVVISPESKKSKFAFLSCCKANTHFQTMAFSLALYLAFPFIQITCTPLVLRGVGIRTWGGVKKKKKTFKNRYIFYMQLHIFSD